MHLDVAAELHQFFPGSRQLLQRDLVGRVITAGTHRHFEFSRDNTMHELGQPVPQRVATLTLSQLLGGAFGLSAELLELLVAANRLSGLIR